MYTATPYIPERPLMTNIVKVPIHRTFHRLAVKKLCIDGTMYMFLTDQVPELLQTSQSWHAPALHAVINSMQYCMH